MKRLSKLTLNLTLALALVAFFSNYSFAQDTGDDAVTHGAGFVDENGDGFNDNAPDADGDGIPNGMDEDYVGSKTRSGNGNGHGAHGFVDADGDGINDNAVDSDGDGIPNGQDEDYVRPEDGTGNMHKYGKSNMKQNKNMKGAAKRNGQRRL
jgi:hypothetical protein